MKYGHSFWQEFPMRKCKRYWPQAKVNFVCFWVIPRRLNFICRRFGTLCLFHLHWRIGVVILHLSVHEDGTECSETSAYTIQTPGNYPEESIQHSQHAKSLKSRKGKFVPHLIEGTEEEWRCTSTLSEPQR